MLSKEELQKGFHIGDWEVLPARHVLRRGDEEAQPEPKVFEVLMCLAMRDGDIVTKDELINECWGGRATSDDVMTRAIFQLRGVFGDHRPYQYIETINRVGYRLMQPVVPNEPAAPEVAALVPDASTSSRNWLAAAALVALAALAWAFWPSPPVDGDIRSVAVMPLEFLGAAEEDQYIGPGIQQEISQTLGNDSELLVKNINGDYGNMEFTEIAEVLDVDGLLTGVVQRQGELLKVSYEIVDGRTGLSVASESITKPSNEKFELQLEVARAVRKDLLGKSRQQLMSASRPASSAAYDSYLRGLTALERRGEGEGEYLEAAIELLRETIGLDPKFGPAYLKLATAYALSPNYRGAPRDESYAQAIETVELGIAADSSISEAASAVFGFIFHKQKKWAQSEAAYLRAINAKVVDANAFNWYSRMLASVGRLDAALEQALAALEIDPSSAVINVRVAVAYTWLDEQEKALEFFARAEQQGAASAEYILGYAWSLSLSGRIKEAIELADTGVTKGDGNTDWIEPFFAAASDPLDPSLRHLALEALDVAAAEGRLVPLVEVPTRAVMGDLDGAMRVARVLEEPGEAFEMDILFISELLPLRQHPEFLDLMKNLGVQEYWDETGCIWEAAAVHCPKPL